MKKYILICILILLEGVLFSAMAQEQDSIRVDEVQIDSLHPLREAGDTVKWVDLGDTKVVSSDSIILVKPEFKPDPNKALLYSAIFPGLGQVYNRKYWKLPIVYGGFFGVAYGISWNGRYAGDYARAYTDLVLGEGDSWTNFSRYTKEELDGNPSLKESEISRFKRQKDTFRRNRDLAIIVGVGLYALCMIDAYVDAQLYNFDISDDLSMNVTPVVWGPTSYTKTSFGIQCSINF
jgi:hypothetical protein